MRVISYGRRGGKTVWLISKLRENKNAILVCMNHQELDRLHREYPDIPIGQFASVDEVRDGKLRGLNPRPELYVDNLDIIINRWLGERVTLASVTSEVDT